MNDPPFTTREIADLLHRIRELSDNPASDPAERAEVLAHKADLIARLANQRATELGVRTRRPSPPSRARSPKPRDPGPAHHDITTARPDPQIEIHNHPRVGPLLAVTPGPI
jgi:hypothetical protein